jgi:oligo-1,6-glucosidase/alpha-glucosidase
MARLPFWQTTSVYQIYPRSFCDSNGDGIGDLPGIISRLDYLRELGVETLWLSPFFQSPQRDFGYDISDHYAIAPEYGTLADVRRLIDETHARGMRVVLDMVLNHTSDQHPWFQKSRQSQSSRERDYYIWRPGRRPGGAAPPNNWRSMLGPRGWNYDAATDEWYFATFLPFQPDLNYRNPVVKAAMLDMVRHWLRQGVDGLRLDIFNAIFKDPSLRDNPPSLRVLPSEDSPDGYFQRNLYTIDHPDTLEFARELRAAVDEVGAADGRPRFLVGEVFGPPVQLRRYCGPRGDGLNLVFLFKTLRTPFSATAFRKLIAEYEQEFPSPLLPTYVLDNHDRPRYLERLDNDRARARLLATLQLTARGVPFLYYGDEIGMENSDIPAARAQDAVAQRMAWLPLAVTRRLRKKGILINRDECRTPMQWDGSPGAGFTAAGVRPWLPLHEGYPQVNVAAQKDDPESLWRCYQRLLRLRRDSPALHAGSLALWDASLVPAEVLAYRRVAGAGSATQTLDVLLNFADSERVVELSRPPTVLFSTHGEAAPARRLRLRAFEAVVLARAPATPDVPGDTR